MSVSYTGRNHPFGLDYEGDIAFEKKAASKKEDDNVDSEGEFEFEGPKKKKKGGNEVSKNDFIGSKVVWLSYINDSFDHEIFSAYQDSIKNQDNSDDKKDEDAKDKVAEVVKVCEYCGASPCLVHYVYEEMMFIAEGMEDECQYKEIRYAMYCFVAKKLWGPLRKGFRKRIPHCIIAEIHDAYPAKKGTDYVGFKDVVEDSDK
jgi:hypothetical protein